MNQQDEPLPASTQQVITEARQNRAKVLIHSSDGLQQVLRSSTIDIDQAYLHLRNALRLTHIPDLCASELRAFKDYIIEHY